jgi:hypothetical protein
MLRNMHLMTRLHAGAPVDIFLPAVLQSIFAMTHIQVVCVTSLTADKSKDSRAVDSDLETRKLAFNDVSKVCDR